MINKLNESTANSNGVYSLYNGWLKEPVRDEIPDVDLEPELSDWKEKAKEAGKTIKSITKFIDDVYKLRQDSILKEGEYGKGNLIFKELRNEGILQGLKDHKVELENDEMSIKEEYHEAPDIKLIEQLINWYWPCDKSELDDIWDEIMERYNDPELAEEVCASLEIKIDNMYQEALSPEKLDDIDVINESEIFNQKNEACIKEYRQWAGLGDDDLITEDTINEWALNRVSCNNNYDYNDLKEVLLSSNK